MSLMGRKWLGGRRAIAAPVNEGVHKKDEFVGSKVAAEVSVVCLSKEIVVQIHGGTRRRTYRTPRVHPPKND